MERRGGGVRRGGWVRRVRSWMSCGEWRMVLVGVDCGAEKAAIHAALQDARASEEAALLEKIYGLGLFDCGGVV